MRLNPVVIVLFFLLFFCGESIARPHKEGVSKAGRPASEELKVQIAAKVNDQIITVKDVNQRIAFISTTGGEPVDRKFMWPMILKNLIEEKLKLQAAQKYNISLNEDDLLQNKTMIANNFGMSAEQLQAFLEKHNFSETFDQMLKSQGAWQDLLNNYYSNDLKITKRDLQQNRESIEKNSDVTSYHIAEVLLAQESSQKNSQKSFGENVSIKQQAEALVQRLKKGAKFESIAQQFSSSPTAKLGGDRGWIYEYQLDSKIREAIKSGHKEGDIIGPIETEAGVYIIKLLKVRPNNQEEMVTIKQFFIPLDPAKTEEHAAHIKKQYDINKSNKENFDELESKILGSKVAIEVEVPVSHISPSIYNMIKNLPIGVKSQPLMVNGGMVLLSVIEKSMKRMPAPSEKEIAEILTNMRMQQFSQKMLRYVYNSSNIEVYYKE